MTLFVCSSEDFHPYECDGPGRCRHCDHDPATCELCEPLDENPSYGPGNPDWERDFDRTAEDA